jgi:hypothetical protein
MDPVSPPSSQFTVTEPAPGYRRVVSVTTDWRRSNRQRSTRPGSRISCAASPIFMRRGGRHQRQLCA